MREQATKIILIALLGLITPFAAAATAKTPHRLVASTPTKARLKPTPRETVSRARALHAPKANGRNAPKPLAGRRGKLTAYAPASHRRGKPEPRVLAVHARTAPAPVMRRDPDPVPENEPDVRHDRKQHFTPDAVEASPVTFDRRGRVVMPPAMKGSHEILVHQNTMADEDGLDRIRDDEDLDQMRQSKLLVAIPAGQGLLLDERLPLNRRYCRPWTAQFLEALSRAHYQRFHTALQVNSAVRTVEFQQRLLRTNGNAAPAAGETASPHLTGQAVDLAKKGLSLTEIAWLRGYLLPLVQAGKIDVEEEFQQSCFHISVYRKFVPELTPKRDIAEHRSVGATSLAVAIP